MAWGDPMTVVLSAGGLSPEEVEAIALGKPLIWAPGLAAELASAEADFSDLLARGTRVYGVTTEVAARSSYDIPAALRPDYQLAMLRSHACGTGALLDRVQARAAWVTKAAGLATGRSGCSVAIVRAITDALNAGLAPAVPVTGSLAASGDLVPSAHAALPLLGEGELLDATGAAVPAGPVLAGAGLRPVALGPRDGLSLVNGTSVTAALGSLALLGAERLICVADVLAGAGFEARPGHSDALSETVIAARPHRGALTSAAAVNGALGTAVGASREAGARFHDPYGWRCVPQVHGAAHDALRYLRDAVSTELRSCTDNPLQGGAAGLVSGGNFHAAPLGIPLDTATVALTVLAGLSRQRLVQLLDQPTLPQALVGPGGKFGLTMLVATATAHVLELAGLSPASTRWLPVDDVEDHVANATASARQLGAAVAGAQIVLAAEAMALAATVDLGGLRPVGPGLQVVYAMVRDVVGVPGADRSESAALTTIGARIAELATLRGGAPG